MSISNIVKAACIATMMAAGAAQADYRFTTMPEPKPLAAANVTGMVAIKGERVYFETHGTKGPWIIFLHGGTSTVLSWGSQVPAFAENNRVLLIESRGHGRSTWDGTPLSYDRMASDTVAVMDALGIEKAPVVGWSDGGNTALIMGINFPDRVEKIVTSGSNAEPEGIDTSVFDKPPYTFPNSMSERAYKIVSPTPERWDAFRDAVFKMWEVEPHISGKLKQIKVPVLAIVGERDVIKPEHTKMIVDSIPGAKQAVLPGTSHYVLFEDPDAFNKTVKDFLGVK